MSLHLAQDRTTSVPQALTHKANRDEVLLDRWGQTGADAFTVTARWPRSHSFYLTRHGLHDPLLLSETIRQTLPLISHGAYEVPLGHQLLWRDFHWSLAPEALTAEEDDAEIELRITCTDVTYRRNRAAALTMHVEALRDGAHLAAARTGFSIQERSVYERLRGRYADIAQANARSIPLSPPASAAPAGRERFADVVLSNTDSANRWQLRADTAHPVLFDHPVDHVPGMLLLEAARQSAQAMTHPRQSVVVGMDSAFTRYVELDSPCWLLAEPLPDDLAGHARVRVVAEQNDAVAYSCVVVLAEAPTA
ncbi:ScbA/BarX family gamma-butyrolactone biosynthesis protein [Streptomyces sp. NPDC045251]|uniref:ScbA/BarX family gamma-butyrolactone biosynthesis protein n=1 Tax=unclassified Streptomyces TaxID=2593676 RepID=UPI0033CAC426